MFFMRKMIPKEVRKDSLLEDLRILKEKEVYLYDLLDSIQYGIDVIRRETQGLSSGD